ncbi:hypothetical protein MRB53_037509 [Persea americana]|nr:hypothetical protein MRB53_037509 [Persea americana]
MSSTHGGAKGTGRRRGGCAVAGMLEPCSLALPLARMHRTMIAGDADEELLSSAVQACMGLSTLMMEGWHRNRPERSTPRASQTQFPPSARSVRSEGRSTSTFSDRTSPSLTRSSSALSVPGRHRAAYFNPETPTTIFDDIAETGDEDEDQVDRITPAMIVLGENARHDDRVLWSSSTSSHSSRTSGSAPKSASTGNTMRGHSADNNLAMVRLLIARTAMNVGFAPRVSHAASFAQQNQALTEFVRNLPLDALGGGTHERELCRKYKDLVLRWPEVVRVAGGSNVALSAGLVGGASGQATPHEIAAGVKWISLLRGLDWLPDLYEVYATPDSGQS